MSHNSELDCLSRDGRFDQIKGLLADGADPLQLSFETRRGLLGLHPEPSERLLTTSCADYERAAHPRFGEKNPERIDEPFWHAMVISGVDGWQASEKYQFQPEANKPVWCARRFGQSITFLPDGRIVQVAGEHEDSYDPDFCIYNDVFVHHPDGWLEIFGYPESVFPPTDFHTATLVGEVIYLIGSLGYERLRQPGITQVFRLDTRTFRIEHVQTEGDAPGRIFKHRALLTPRGEIRVFGGYLDTGKKHTAQTPNKTMFALDLRCHRWIRIADA